MKKKKTKNQILFAQSMKKQDELFDVKYELEEQAKRLPAKIAYATKEFEKHNVENVFLSLQVEFEEYSDSATKLYELQRELHLFPDHQLTTEQKALRDKMDQTFGDWQSSEHPLLFGNKELPYIADSKCIENLQRQIAEYKWPIASKAA